MAAGRTVVVTGANRGIGFEVVRQLVAWEAPLVSLIIATARDASTAADLAALARSNRANGPLVQVTLLDVTSEESARAFASGLAAEGVKVDVLVNNAGVYTAGGRPERAPARLMDVNYFGPRRVTDAVRTHDLLRPEGLVVHVSSGLGSLSAFSPSAAAELLSHDLTVERLDDLVGQYARNHALSGWPSDSYSASKAALNALMRVQARDGLRAVSVCPCWVRTEMGGPAASRSVEEGADTIVWLAATGGAAGPHGPAARPGRMYRDRRECEM